MPFSKYSQFPVESRISANDIKNIKTKLFSKYSQFPVESRISANSIKISKKTKV